MLNLTIAVGSDHAGYPLKVRVVEFLQQQKVSIFDLGTLNEKRTDYPDFALKVARAVADASCQFGIVICGTGIGVSITANKVRGIRAALCCSEYMAEMARKHNNANVLALGSRTTEPELANKIVATFLTTSFEGGRHALRVEKIHNLTNL